MVLRWTTGDREGALEPRASVEAHASLDSLVTDTELEEKYREALIRSTYKLKIHALVYMYM